MEKKIGKENAKIIFSVLTLLFTLILLISFVNASGVSRPYWSANPLKLAPGESTIVTLSLQNMVGGGNIIFSASLTSGSEIATLIDDNTDYLVPFGSNNVPVNIRVEIPEDTELQSSYNVGVSLREVSSGEGGMVRLASGISTSFPVQIVGFEESVKREGEAAVSPQPTKPISIPVIWIIIGIVLIGALVLIGARRRKPTK